MGGMLPESRPESLTAPPVSSILNTRAVSRLHVRAVDRLDAVIEKTTLWIHLGRLQFAWPLKNPLLRPHPRLCADPKQTRFRFEGFFSSASFNPFCLKGFPATGRMPCARNTKSLDHKFFRRKPTKEDGRTREYTAVNNFTTIPSGKNIQRKWFVIDATGKTLGRLATTAASVLAGKHNPLYTPYIDMGDHIVVINCEKIVLTGLKSSQKLYRRYTGFPGGLREESFVKLLARRPEAIVEQAIKGMLPKSKMGRQMATKLKVYKGSQHPHLAQQPEPLEFHASNAPKA